MPKQMVVSLAVSIALFNASLSTASQQFLTTVACDTPPVGSVNSLFVLTDPDTGDLKGIRLVGELVGDRSFTLPEINRGVALLKKRSITVFSLRGHDAVPESGGVFTLGYRKNFLSARFGTLRLVVTRQDRWRVYHDGDDGPFFFNYIFFKTSKALGRVFGISGAVLEYTEDEKDRTFE